MTEKLLQFIWKNRYFSQRELTLLSGERLFVENPGEENSNQGPDFIHARIWINGICWVGSVELHLLSSGWSRHGHEEDENYRNVILHVVWKQDEPGRVRNIPQLELYQRVSGMMLDTYSSWMNQHHFIPCEQSLPKAAAGVWESWQRALLFRRLDRRMIPVMQSLLLNHYHWEEQLWWMLARNFGLEVNARAFETMARSIPFNLLAKHRQHGIQLEALFFGQANLLKGNFREKYPVMLKNEFQFLNAKYRLQEVFEQVHFLRMRPDNFPTIRLSQLAALFTESTNLFAWILECGSLDSLRKKLAVCSNSFWFKHYLFDRESPFKIKILGKKTRESLIINAVIPLLYTYGKVHPDKSILEKAISWMDLMPAEQNYIIVRWKRLGMKAKRATGSQALLELKKEFCQHRKCLDCDIGRYLLQASGK